MDEFVWLANAYDFTTINKRLQRFREWQRSPSTTNLAENEYLLKNMQMSELNNDMTHVTATQKHVPIMRGTLEVFGLDHGENILH